MFDKLGLYIRLTRMDRPIGWLLLLWPTLWGVWIAGEGSPRPVVVAIFVAGVIVMRAAGCIVNDYLDRDLDRHVAALEIDLLQPEKYQDVKARHYFLY